MVRYNSYKSDIWATRRPLIGVAACLMRLLQGKRNPFMHLSDLRIKTTSELVSNSLGSILCPIVAWSVDQEKIA